MADQKYQSPPSRSVGASSAESFTEPSSNAQRAQDVKRDRGGEQTDQLSGETQKGAHNNEMRGQNPQGNKPNQNRAARQKGNTF
jgi:hypothetical protein